MSERKGKKLRRISPDSKVYYKLQFGKTDDNKRKRLQHHLRTFPNDMQAVRVHEDKYKKPAPSPNKAGFKILRREEQREKEAA